MRTSYQPSGGSGSRQQPSRESGAIQYCPISSLQLPGRWRIHHQEGGRLQPRRNQGAEVHQRNTQSTRLFHVCEAFSCRWHNYKPSRWNAPQRRLFRPCSRFVEQQAIQRHHGHGRKIFIRCTRISQGIHLERRSEGTARNKGTHSRNRQLKAHKT